MRLRWSSGRRLMAPATRIAAGFRRMMGAPLRRPRMTTRLLMLVVAIVAIGIWAVMDVPQAIDRAIVYRGKAGFHAELERRSRDMERDRSTRARAIQSEFDQWRRDGGSADQLTEHYFASRLEFYVIDAEYQREMATYHANLKNQYRWARWFPFVPAAREIAPPPDPLQSPALAHEPGKTYEIVAEGGVSVAFSPVGAGLAVGCRDKTIKLLELPSRRMRASFPLGAGEPDSVVFSPDGATLLAAGDRQFVRRWDVATGRAGRPIPWIGQSPGQPGTFMFAKRGGLFARRRNDRRRGRTFPGKTFKRDRRRQTFRHADGLLKWEHKATANVPRSVSFSPDGETLAFGNGAAVLLDTRTGNVKKTLKPAIEPRDSGGLLAGWTDFGRCGCRYGGPRGGIPSKRPGDAMGRFDRNDPADAGGTDRRCRERRLLARRPDGRGGRDRTAKDSLGQARQPTRVQRGQRGQTLGCRDGEADLDRRRRIQCRVFAHLLTGRQVARVLR